MEENKIRKVFLDNLPRRGKTNQINWKKSIGFKVDFIYDDIKGNIEIIKYNSKSRIIKIKYDNKEFNIDSRSFYGCLLGAVVGTKTSEFKIEIGQTFKDKKRDITITDRKTISDDKNRKWKMYKYKCNQCGFECGKHYSVKDNRYKEELWMLEGSLLYGKGCACCCNPVKIVVQGINDIVTTHPHLIKYFKNIEDIYIYSHSSNKRKLMLCPICGYEKEMGINTLSYNGFGCLNCNDNIPFGEKVIFNIFKQLKLNFQSQLTKTTFDWCQNYRYDFYFELNNEKYIIETHGLQHYKDCTGNWKMSLKDVQENDRLKKELALQNRIKEKNYIVIDCRKSELEWIRDNDDGILNSRLAELFDLNKIDWVECGNFILSSLVEKACQYKRDNIDMTTTKISKIMGYDISTISGWLKQGSEIWDWVSYDAEEEINKTQFKKGVISHNAKRTEIFKDNISLGIFNSAHELEIKSEKLFGVKLDSRKISLVCNGKKPQYKGYTFKFAS